MREQDFREWLESNGAQSPNGRNSRVHAVRTIEKQLGALGFAYADLDEAWATDRFDDVRQAIADLRRDFLGGGSRFKLLMPEAQQPRNRLSNWRSWLGQYGRFLAGEGTGTGDADRIRQHLLEQYIEPARERNEQGVECLVRQINDELALNQAWPNICQALRGAIFQKLADVPPPQSFGADMSTATRFRFDLDPADYWALASLRKRYGQPLAPTKKMASFALRDGRQVALDLEASRAQLWVEGRVAPLEVPGFEVTPYSADAPRHSNLPARLSHTGPEARAVSMVRVPNARVLGQMLDGYEQGMEAGMTDNELLARFDRSQLFRDGRVGWTEAQVAAFCITARAVHDAGLDWWFVDIDRAPVRFGRKSRGRQAAEGVAGYFSVTPPRLSSNSTGIPALQFDGFRLDAHGAVTFAQMLADEAEAIAAWKTPRPPRPGLWPDEGESEIDRKETNIAMTDPTNLILYGPPGTGKTYRTAHEAVKLCDGRADYPDDDAGRAALMARYRELVSARRIDFVTFHQTFAYEDFVEGLRPDITPGGGPTQGGFRLKPENGIFASIADRAGTPVSTGADRLTLEGRAIFKLSLGQSDDPHSAWVYQESLEEGYALFGFRDVDWSDARFVDRDAILRELEARYPDERVTPQMGMVKSPDRFRNQLAIGDIVVVTKGLNAFRALGVVEGEYEYAPRDHGRYSHRRKVRWLWNDPDGVPVAELSPDTRFSLETIYELPRGRLNLAELQRLIDSGQADEGRGGEVLPHVLIIDEINRANISKVFGELITLIEPDKRLGRPNALTVRLPYSRREFGVPPNLHIVGTMNTADRSIALLDTALRRRFRFEELAPDSTKLNADVEGVPLRRVLETINKRLEYLLDRDHAIGHAFFMGEGGADLDAIDRTMRSKVIPLLQEYFFEDWGRIHAVLGDGFVTSEALTPPPGISNTRDRRSWAIRKTRFPAEAYHKLVGKGEATADAFSDEQAEE